MTEQKPYSPARFWRLNQTFRNLSVNRCEGCDKGHLLPRSKCLEENISAQTLVIEANHDEIYAAKETKDEATS